MKINRSLIFCMILAFSVFILSGCGSILNRDAKDDTMHLSDETLPEYDESNVDGSDQGDVSSSETNQTENTDDTDNTDNTNNADDTDDIGNIDVITSVLQQMTLKEKIGQLFIIRPDSLDETKTDKQINSASAKGVKSLTDQMKNVLHDYPAGGIVMFSKNIDGEEQITDFITSLQSSSDLPLFIAIDEEGGTVARLGNNSAFDLPQYKSAADVGKSGDASDAKAMGNTIGSYLRRYLFNMDFAPVADVNTNPKNPVIGDRAFSSDPIIASQMASAMAEGLNEQNIIPVFKHFPGHGDTAEDSHSGIAISYKTQEEMENCEWLPYESLEDEYCVMVGHIATPNITGDLTPATMSYDIVSGILRQKIGFDGVIITDSLSMGAIIDEYGPEEAAIKAIEAGCDILLMPQNFQKAFDAVLEAVENGDIDEQRIDESVYRILTLKQSYGLLY